MGKVFKALAAALTAMVFAMRVATHTMAKVGATARYALTGKSGDGGGKVRSYKSIYKEYYGATPEIRKEARDNPEYATKPQAQTSDQANAKSQMEVAEREEVEAKQQSEAKNREKEETKKEADKEEKDAKKEVEAKKNVEAQAQGRMDYVSKVRDDKAKTSSLAGKLGGMTTSNPEDKASEPKPQPTESQAEAEERRRKAQVPQARPAGMND